jgi:hypothetical protein
MSMASKRQMRRNAIMVQIVSRQTDRLVEGLDAFAVPDLRFIAAGLGMLGENQLCPASRCGTTVALVVR